MELSLLEELISEDFGLTVISDRWARADEHDSLVVDREKQKKKVENSECLLRTY
jgi:hypothetical protein